MRHITILDFESGKTHIFPFKDYYDQFEFSEIA